MKKILYSLVIFISVFFVIDKVSAAFELTGTSVTLNQSVSTVNGNLYTKMYGNPTLTYGNATYNYIVNNFIPNELWKEYGEYYWCDGNGTGYASRCYITDNPDNFYVSFTTMSMSSLFIKFSTTEENSVYSYIISSGSKASSSGYVTESGNYYSNTGSNSGDYIRTNLPYIRTKFSSVDTLIIDDYYFNSGDIVLIMEDDELVVNTDYKTSVTPEYYTFNEEIDDINYSKMIFDFDVSVFKERGNIFDYLIEFHTLGTILEDMTLNEEHKQKFSRPYIEYIDENGITRKLDIDFGYDDQSETRSYWYVGNQDEISGDISSLKLIVPMHETAYARYSIELISFIPSTVSYVTNEESLSYYETVDLTNKYGIIFMPKLVANNSDISSLFYTTGIESVLVYDSYDYKQQPIATYDSNLSEFNYTISYENINYNLFFKVNHLTPALGVVTYDTRYYTYEIADSKYSIGSVTNPNTGETNSLDYSNTDNASSNFESMSDVFEFIGNTFDKNNEAYILFSDSLNVFFNTMPTDIYIFILTLLVIILIGTGLALGGWK